MYLLRLPCEPRTRTIANGHYEPPDMAWLLTRGSLVPKTAPTPVRPWVSRKSACLGTMYHGSMHMGSG